MMLSPPELSARRSWMGVADAKTVLVAEDDPAVRKYLQQVLEANGFCVLAAGDGAEAGVRHFLAKNLRSDGGTVVEADSGSRALSARAGARETFSLLLADLDSPGVDGRQLFDLLSAAHPGLRVGYVTSRREQVPVI